eukprot:2917012-Rhodomonas_salina.2
MAAWCAGSGAALLAGAAWMHSSACQTVRRAEVAEKAPMMRVEDIWARLRKESSDNPKLRPAVFAKLRGQTWVPESFAVRDRHGDLQVRVAVFVRVASDTLEISQGWFAVNQLPSSLITTVARTGVRAQRR